MSQIFDAGGGQSIVADNSGVSASEAVLIVTPPPKSGPPRYADISGFGFLMPGSMQWNVPINIFWDVVKKVPYTATYTWNHHLGGDLFDDTERVVTLKIVTVIGPTWQPKLVTRQWMGIGGLQYLPSFPQLERQVTTWPHAL